jgi:hypothetical protein
MKFLPVQFGRTLVRKIGRRVAWALIVPVFIVGSLWVAARATNQDLASLLPHGGAKAAATGASGYGFATSLVGLSPTELNRKLDGIKATGATWVRFDLSWDAVQHASAASYNWAPTDAVAQAAAVRGLKVVMIVDFVPPWARPAGCTNSQMCGPADPAAYGRFAAVAAAHYRAYGVENWEIWNEPNISYRFHPAANPSLYVAMLKASYAAIKQADPNATVIAASTAPAATEHGDMRPDDFIQAMYDDGAAGSFDALSVHPYTYPETPAQSNPADAWGQMQSIRDMMVAHGDGAKKIWITEFGAPTAGPNEAGDHVSEAVQAQSVTEAISIFRSYTWSGPFFWYDYRDSGGSALNSENFYGLVRADGTFKPSYRAFEQAVATYK